MFQRILKVNKKIIVILILFAAAVSGFVFAYQKHNQYVIKNSENKNTNGYVENLKDIKAGAKKIDYNPELATIAGSSKKGAGGEQEFSKSIETIARISERFLGIEKKDILYSIGKKLEYKPKIIKVPQDYRSIQLAINNASDKDVIEVSPGEYKENIIMKEGVSVIGKNTSNDEEKEPSSEASELGSFSSLPSQTILDGNNFGNVVTFKSGVTNKTELAGFVIKNSGENLSGIMIEDSSGWIHDNVITSNGYNIYIKGKSNPIIQKNFISFANKGIQVYNSEDKSLNSAEDDLKKSADFEKYGKPIIIDNVIVDNKVGIDIYNGAAFVDHNNISYNNHYKTYLGATFGINISNSSADIINNIITDSGICELCAGINVDGKSKEVKVDFNNIWNNKNDFVCFGECELGENNISEDPLYTDPAGGNYGLNEESGLIGRASDELDVGVRW